jgi:hypothetical protein
VDLSEVPEGLVAYCPECGQGLKAPKPWTPVSTAEAIDGPCLSSSQAKTKMPGGVGVFMGVSAIAVGWAFPGINVYLSAGATLLGCALLIEGLGRIRAEARKQQPRRPAPTLDLDADRSAELEAMGSLQGVFESPNSWMDSLAILCFGLAIGCGGLFLLDWMAGGVISAKLILAVILAPPMTVYLVYRAVRNLMDRHRVLLFTHGLVHVRGTKMSIYPWDRVAGVTQQELGDAIDEKAVEIRLTYGQAPLRFTCVHFPNLDRFMDRLQQGYSRYRALAQG